jgi:hypothetical protein
MFPKTTEGSSSVIRTKRTLLQTRHSRVAFPEAEAR